MFSTKILSFCIFAAIFSFPTFAALTFPLDILTDAGFQKDLEEVGKRLSEEFNKKIELKNLEIKVTFAHFLSLRIVE